MTDALHLLVRTAHVLGVVVLLGGSASAWYALGATPRPLDAELVRFECAFWAALGVVVVTGVGNLGALGAPGPGTRWGGVLTVKLVVVACVAAGSLPRTLAVVRTGPASLRRTAVRRRVRGGYAATAGGLVLAVVLAEVLAHG